MQMVDAGFLAQLSFRHHRRASGAAMSPPTAEKRRPVSVNNVVVVGEGEQVVDVF
jgi:hypothetical protein